VKKLPISRHPGESRGPGILKARKYWIPASAGMTGKKPESIFSYLQGVGGGFQRWVASQIAPSNFKTVLFDRAPEESRIF
jgi:hypothetical protein